jgi:hypothetical protein
MSIQQLSSSARRYCRATENNYRGACVKLVLVENNVVLINLTYFPLLFYAE